MKLKITKPGYHDHQGKPVEVGTVITIDGDKVPAALLNKCEVVADDGSGGLITGQNTGPTVEEFVAAGYRAENYPPQGYESRSTPEEIAAAIEAQKAKDEAAKVDGLTVDELKAHLTDKGVQFPDNAKKADLVALAKR